MRTDSRTSFGCRTVIRVMSIAGPTKKSSAATVRSPRRPRMTISASSAISAGAVSEGVTATQREASKMQCSRFIDSGVSA